LFAALNTPKLKATGTRVARREYKLQAELPNKLHKSLSEVADMFERVSRRFPAGSGQHRQIKL
jgi:hypothetical protein